MNKINLLKASIAVLGTFFSFSLMSKENVEGVRAIVTEHPSGVTVIDLIKEPTISETHSTPKINYEEIAQKLRSGCASAQTDQSIPYPATAIDLDPEAFFIIQGKAKLLPPKPSDHEAKATIHGIDADGDCVRDDIEHYIAKKYSNKDQYQLRKYLYEYAAWLNRFLAQNLDENTGKTAYNNIAAAGVCIQQLVGYSESLEVLNDLEAQFHNTWPRFDRNLENTNTIGGWTTRQSQVIRCP